MGGANTSKPARHNLAALGHKALQKAHIAIRDCVDFLGAELADFFAAEKLAATTGATGGTSAGTSAGACRR